MKIHKSCNLPPLAVYISRKSNPFLFISCCQIIVQIVLTTVYILPSTYFCQSRSDITACMIYAFVMIPSLSVSMWRKAASIYDFRSAWHRATAERSPQTSVFIYIIIFVIFASVSISPSHNLLLNLVSYHCYNLMVCRQAVETFYMPKYAFPNKKIN